MWIHPSLDRGFSPKPQNSDIGLFGWAVNEFFNRPFSGLLVYTDEPDVGLRSIADDRFERAGDVGGIVASDFPACFPSVTLVATLVGKLGEDRTSLSD